MSKEAEWLAEARETICSIHVHKTLGEYGLSGTWWGYYLIGTALLLVPYFLSIANPCFQSAPTLFPVLMGINGGSVFVLLTHVWVYDARVKFCTRTQAHNHILTVCALLCLHSAWWSALQAWAATNSLWFILPLGIFYAIEFAFYLPALWGRRLKICALYKEGHTEITAFEQDWMLFLDLCWFGCQISMILLLIWFQGEISVELNRPAECQP